MNEGERAESLTDVREPGDDETMHVRASTLADGREIVYYTFGDGDV